MCVLRMHNISALASVLADLSVSVLLTCSIHSCDKMLHQCKWSDTLTDLYLLYIITPMPELCYLFQDQSWALGIMMYVFCWLRQFTWAWNPIWAFFHGDSFLNLCAALRASADGATASTYNVSLRYHSNGPLQTLSFLCPSKHHSPSLLNTLILPHTAAALTSYSFLFFSLFFYFLSSFSYKCFCHFVSF